MGFVKRSIELEEYLDSVRAEWQLLADREYNRVLSTLNEFIDPKDYWSLSGDKAFKELESKLPLEGYIFSAPRHQLFSIYEGGGENLTIGYSVGNLSQLHREKLNNIECVISNKQLTFACMNLSQNSEAVA